MFACPAFISVSVFVHLPADVSFFAESLLHRNAQLLPWQQWRIKKKTLGSFFVVVVAAFDLFFVCDRLKFKQMWRGCSAAA